MAFGGDTDLDTGPVPGASALIPVGDRLGRYTIESALGRGGVGVVYLAYDPDLERRVAVKVLQDDDPDHRARLLREARAMARLAHAGVVTVFDVGTVDGRDYVTMELMDGGTLADWLAKPRRPRDVVAAFVACGRGLAAAHAAGLVHRDVKPANVLRAADGRFALTDFGLAREHGAAPAPRARSDVHVVPRPSPALADVTVTGAVLGTPQYMAPEQWVGEATPASDQFAFCVAMFEAFAGVRPFEGADGEAMRAAIQRGPGAIDAAAMRAVPRRLRAIVARGLEPDPARRWPTMGELLAAIARAERRPRQIAAASSGMLALVGTSLLVAAWASNARAPAPSAAAAAPSCRAPRVALSDVWRGDLDVAAVSARGAYYGSLGAELADDAAEWTRQRERACAAGGAEREATLACLDGVLARFALVRGTALAEPASPAIVEFLGRELAAPAICAPASGEPPRLLGEWSPAARIAFAGLAQQLAVSVDPVTHVSPPVLPPADGSDDPCAQTLALEIAAFRDPMIDAKALATASERAALCPDDRMLADALVAQLRWTPGGGAAYDEIAARARRAVARVSQPDLESWLATLSPDLTADRFVQRIPVVARARDAFARRHLDVSRLIATRDWLAGLSVRRQGDDLDQIARVLPAAMAEAAPMPDIVADLRAVDSLARWMRGDIAGAHDTTAQLVDAPYYPDDPAKRRSGRVVDVRGRPVAGARIAAGSVVLADASLLGLFFELRVPPLVVTTDARGAFSLPVPEWVTVVAEADGGKLRSRAGEAGSNAPLVVEPTRTVQGRVTFHGGRPSSPIVAIHAADKDCFKVIAPLAKDDAFEIAGVPDGPIDITVGDRPWVLSSNVTRVDCRGDVRGLDVVVEASTRVVTVTVRSTAAAPVRSAEVWLLEPGHHPTRLPGVADGHVYAEADAALDATETATAAVRGAPAGQLVACAAAMFTDKDQFELFPPIDDEGFACADLAADRDAVTIDVAPPPAHRDRR